MFGGWKDPGSPSSARIKYSMCPDFRATYSCICCCSTRRNAVNRSARSQNASLNVAAVNVHLLPCFTMGAGDSSDINCSALSNAPATDVHVVHQFVDGQPCRRAMPGIQNPGHFLPRWKGALDEVIVNLRLLFAAEQNSISGGK